MLQLEEKKLEGLFLWDPTMILTKTKTCRLNTVVFIIIYISPLCKLKNFCMCLIKKLRNIM
jgi:hypothetical protein